MVEVGEMRMTGIRGDLVIVGWEVSEGEKWLGVANWEVGMNSWL